MTLGRFVKVHAYQEHFVLCPGIGVKSLKYRALIFQGADAVCARELWRLRRLCHGLLRL